MSAPASIPICACDRCRLSPRIKRAAKRIRARFMNPRLVARGTAFINGVVVVVLEDPTDPSGALMWCVLTDVAHPRDLGHAQGLAS